MTPTPSIKTIFFLLCLFIKQTPLCGQLAEWSGEVGYSSTVLDVTSEEIEKAINIENLQHPFLYFDESCKPAIIDRIKNDPGSKRIMDGLIAESFKLLHQPVNYEIPVQGRNTRAGWSEEDRANTYHRNWAMNRNNAFKLAFVYQITGEQKYADKAFEFADAFCDLPSWTGRAHEFPIIYPRIWPWNVNDDQVNFSFDHWNGDSGRIMAAVYDWLYPALDKAQRDRIRGALLEKVITRVRGHYEQHWWATAYRCNWCGVNNSGLGLTALVLLPEHPEFIDVVAESYNRINKMLSELGVDGAWQEGGAYWSYGVHTSAYFADALNRATDYRYNLFNNERLRNNPVTFPLHISLAGGGTLNFEDSRGGVIGPAHLFTKLAAETGSGEAAWYRKNMFQRGGNIFDIIWPDPGVEPVLPETPSIHFRTWDWWVMRSDFTDTQKVLVAGKAGRNNDPHHGHLDVGHFVVHWKKEYYINDIGMPRYDEIYFNDERWDHYPHATSDGHNVVFVNGEKQIPGKRKDSEWDHEIGGSVLEFRTNNERDYVVMDAADAYPGIEMKGWRRHVILEKPEITLVLDEIRCEPGAEIEVRFHSGVNVDIGDEFVMLKGDEGTMALIPVAVEGFSISQGAHAVQIVHMEESLTWEHYFGTIVNSVGETTEIATIILPVNDACEAASVAGSVVKKSDIDGNIEISFFRNGQKYAYLFTTGPDGYKLE